MEKKIIAIYISIIILICVAIYQMAFRYIERNNNIKNIETANKNETENNIIENDKENMFENEVTDGLEKISEEALNIWENFRIQFIYEGNDYKVEKINIEKIKPNNHFSQNYIEGKEKEKVETFYREAYVFYCVFEDGNNRVIGYVDLYNGNVIGGYYMGV